jgi:hypothetical protein
MASAVQSAIISCKIANPDWDNQAIADYVVSTVPGAQTTSASVSSVLSRLKRGGSLSSAQARGQNPALLGQMQDPDPEESDEDAATRIMVRYRAYERHCNKVILRGGTAALIVSGPPGLGKSYQVRRTLEQSGRVDFVEIEERKEFGEDPEGWCAAKGVPGVYDSISGSITAVGLYQALYYMRKGGVLVLDDCDAVFHDPDALNLLKACLDTEVDHRRISWRKESRWLEEYGMPKTFHFEGAVVFLTNIDFEQVIARGNKDAEHFKALIDRSNYLCLTLRSERDFMIRIRQVAAGPNGMIANHHGLPPEHGDVILKWIDDNRSRFYNLSLRLVGQVSETYKDWCKWEVIGNAEEYLAATPDSPVELEWVPYEAEGAPGVPMEHRRIVEVDDEWMDDVIATKTRTF